MRACVQRVRRGRVSVEGEVVGEIGTGAVVLVGAGAGDTEGDADWMADKIAELRFFPDDEGRLNRSLIDTSGAVLAVSQFTLYGDCRKGRRPSFVGAMEPEGAERLYQRFCARVRERGLRCETGRFRAMMEVEIVNWGPVTLWIDSKVPRRQSG